MCRVTTMIPGETPRRSVLLNANESTEVRQLPAAHYRPFFVAAIFILLTTGALWGLGFLFEIAAGQRANAVNLHQINAHGQTVIYGFLGLFIIGFAYQVFPRLWQMQLAYSGLCVPVLAMSIGGAFLLAAGELIAGTPIAGPIVILGGAMQTTGASLFALQMLVTFRRGQAPLNASTGTILVAIAFMVLHIPLNAWHTFNLATSESHYEAIYFTSVYQPALRYLQLHGMVLLMVIGVGSRLLPSFYQIPRPSERKLWIVSASVAAAVLLESGLFVAFRWTELNWVAGLLLIPWCVLLISIAALLAPWRIWRRMTDSQNRSDRMEKFVRASFAWLIVALLMTIAQALWARYVDTYFSHAWYGASRQAFTVGFATLMIMGFTSKVVPTLNGAFPNTLGRLRTAFVLVNVGLAAHIVLQVVSDLHPGVLRAIPIAGVLQIAGFALWAVEMLTHIRRGRRRSMHPEPTNPTIGLRVLNAS